MRTHSLDTCIVSMALANIWSSLSKSITCTLIIVKIKGKKGQDTVFVNIWKIHSSPTIWRVVDSLLNELVKNVKLNFVKLYDETIFTKSYQIARVEPFLNVKSCRKFYIGFILPDSKKIFDALHVIIK